jgi:phosphoadenosine phosphosulfate reductase
MLKGLPTRRVRWRRAELKECGGVGRYCITGVRWEESARRRHGRALHEISGKTKYKTVILNNDNDMRRRLLESCVPKRKFVLNPIIDWTEDDVWAFIKARNLPYNPLYDCGYKRVGCVECPLSKNRKKKLEQFPKYKAGLCSSGEAVYRTPQSGGLAGHSGHADTGTLHCMVVKG